MQGRCPTFLVEVKSLCLCRVSHPALLVSADRERDDGYGDWEEVEETQGQQFVGPGTAALFGKVDVELHIDLQY